MAKFKKSQILSLTAYPVQHCAVKLPYTNVHAQRRNKTRDYFYKTCIKCLPTQTISFQADGSGANSGSGERRHHALHAGRQAQGRAAARARARRRARARAFHARAQRHHLPPRLRPGLERVPTRMYSTTFAIHLSLAVGLAS